MVYTLEIPLFIKMSSILAQYDQKCAQTALKCALPNVNWITNIIQMVYMLYTSIKHHKYMCKYAAMKITHYKYGFLDYLQGVRRK